MTSNSLNSTVKFLDRVTENADNETTFRPKDAPPGHRCGGMRERFKAWYKRLWDCNEGHMNGQWVNRNISTHQQKQDVADAIAFQLDLIVQRKERVKGFMGRVDCQRYSNVGGLEMVAFCLCQIACNTEGCERYYHPQARPDRNDRLFTKLFNDFGFDPQQTANTIQKLRYELDL